MEPFPDRQDIEPWVARIVDSDDAQQRDKALLEATQDLCGPAALWREDSTGTWHPIAGSSSTEVTAAQVEAVAREELSPHLPLVQVIIGASATPRSAIVVDSQIEPDLVEGLLVLAAVCADGEAAPHKLVDLFHGPLPNEEPEKAPEVADPVNDESNRRPRSL